jgi:hypothetical protein
VGAETNDIELENGEKIKACKEYKYLGGVFNQKGIADADIKLKIIKAKKKKKVVCLNDILWSKEMGIKGSIKYMSRR